RRHVPSEHRRGLPPGAAAGAGTIKNHKEELFMSQNDPITINSWTLGDQCAFEERIAAANAAGFEG
ncbi:stage III sporulation protein AC, partial [Dysosmobacter welbionis]